MLSSVFDVPAAINLYSSNGAFKPHEDKEAITVLLNLSDQAEYVGGGTGFWRRARLSHEVPHGECKLECTS